MAAPQQTNQSVATRAEKFLSELPESRQTKNSNLQKMLASASAKIILTLILLLLLFAITFFLSFITLKRNQSENDGAQGSVDCAIGGCNSELCLEASQKDKIVSTCIFRPEYECYKSARCEKQGSGRCGWSQTEDLKSCLSKYR